MDSLGLPWRSLQSLSLTFTSIWKHHVKRGASDEEAAEVETQLQGVSELPVAQSAVRPGVV